MADPDPTVPAVVLIADEVRSAPGAVADGRLLVAPEHLAALSGWELEPQGLCRGERCVPVRDRAAIEGVDGRLDVAAVGAALGHPVALSAEAATAAWGASDDTPGGVGRGEAAPDLALSTLAGETIPLGAEPGRKRMLVAFASWCGCRHDLPAWEAVHGELEPHGFDLIAVALDDDARAVRPWADTVTDIPVVIDPDHRFAEAFGARNVPAVVWLDEDDRVVRSADTQFADDTWVEFTQRPSSDHLAELRRWVVDGVLPDRLAGPVDAHSRPTVDERLSRAERRLAAHLHRQGRDELAAIHFERAAALAPFDWTIRRGALPLRGEDPFGDAFFAMASEWEDAGRPAQNPGHDSRGA